MKNENTKLNKKRELKGVVVGNKMNKTVQVEIDDVKRHPVYQKVMKRVKIYFAHTEDPLNVGDKVVIRETKPVSKNIRWAVVSKE